MNLGIGRKLKHYIRTKVLDPSESFDLQNVVGWHSMNGGATYSHYKDNQYENGYSSITKLANGFASVEPYTIDKTDKPVESNILNRIYTPNTDMSAYDFREALAVMFLVHDEVRLRIHYKGTKPKNRINPDSITGFTFMEGYNIKIVDGKRIYNLLNGEQLTDDDVLTIKSFNPQHVTAGFSASRAAKRWTRLDDYIADYQKGFFANGAVPAGEMVITAGTVSEFNDIVDMMQRKNRGASKNNNITYTHRPTDQNGTPLNAQIEWIPYSTPNKDLGMKELFENTNKKIDSVFGVPAEIRGFLSNSNYASVNVAEKVFVKYALYPMTLKIWTKFNHELNRLTGGTGVAISFKLEIPKVVDEEKIAAESKQINATTVSTLTDYGYTLESAVSYVNTGDLTALEIGKAPQEQTPETLDPAEAKDTPEQPVDLAKKELDSGLKAKRLALATRRQYEDQLKDAVSERMTVQINNAIANYSDLTKAISEEEPIEPAEDIKLSRAMAGVVFGLVAVQGVVEHKRNTQIVVNAGINPDPIKPFAMTTAQRSSYQAYLDKVAAGYNDQTSESIRRILATGRETGLTATQIKDNISGLLAEQYRIDRIAITEINKAGSESSIFSMQNIADQTGATIEKIWNTTAGACEYCEALDGTVVGVEDAFVEQGSTIDGVDGGTYKEDFTDVETTTAHPNCNCYTTFNVSRS